MTVSQIGVLTEFKLDCVCETILNFGFNILKTHHSVQVGKPFVEYLRSRAQGLHIYTWVMGMEGIIWKVSCKTVNDSIII